MRSSIVSHAALHCAALLCAVAGVAHAAEPTREKFELKDGDRVVFLGNTLIEREQKYGYWELMLTMAWPERNVTFRNLGWSGDTVWGESRAGFGTQADGFKKLVEEVNAAKPTVIFVGYGNVEAFEGEAGLPKFTEGFNQLLDVSAPTKARIIVLGPIQQAAAVSPNAEAEKYNDDVELYSAAMQKVCDARSLTFVELLTTSNRIHATTDSPFNATTTTTNGMDVAGTGYFGFGIGIWQKLKWPAPTTTDKSLTDELRKAIVKKNELFFHRWRPQNETYLFGFRKHEQGKNGAEVFQFDPLVEAEEKKIAALRVKLATEMKNGGAK